MLLEYALNRWLTPSKLFNQFLRVIRRSVVHEDDFNIVQDSQASQESRQVVLGVERGDNDRKGQVRITVV